MLKKISTGVLLTIFVFVFLGFFGFGCQPQGEKTPDISPPAASDAATQNHSDPSTQNKTADVEPEKGSKTEGMPDPKTLPPLEYRPGVKPEDILQEMVAAYQKTDSYSDQGYTEILLETDSQEIQSAIIPAIFAWQKPNLVRMEMNQGKMVCDGASIFAMMSAEAFPAFFNTVLELKAPETTTLESLFPDHILMQAMDLQIPPNILLFPPQVVLLFAKNPLNTLVPSDAEVVLLGPQYHNEIACDCIAINDSKGQRVLWVRRDNHALARMELPTELLASPYGKIITFRVEFPNAVFNQNLNHDAFKMEVPLTAVHVKEFVPPEILALGNIPYNNTVLDANDQKVRISADDKKITVSMLFSSDPNVFQDCQAGMETLKILAETLKLEPNVVVRPLAMQSTSDSSEQLGQSLKQWGASFPFYRMIGTDLAQELNLDTIPTFLIFDTTGKLQLYLRGVVDVKVLEDAVRDLLAGKDVFPSWANENNEIQNAFRTALAEYIGSDIFFAGEQKVAIAATSEPTKFHRTKLWEKELKNACNPLIVKIPGRDDLIVVPNNLQFLSVMTKDGEFVETEDGRKQVQPQGIAPNEPLHYVREAFSSQRGKRYLASYALNGKKVYYFDETLDSIGNWPGTSDPGNLAVSDVRLLTLSPQGIPDVFLSLLPRDNGKDLIRRAEMNGNTIWDNDTLLFPDQLALVIKNGTPTIWTINRTEPTNNLVELDLSGKVLKQWNPGENALIWKCVASDLDDDGNSEVAVILVSGADYLLAGVGPTGSILWSYPFPAGNHEAFQFEFLTSGSVVGDPKTKEWVLVSADSVVHIIDVNGKLIDKFAYGKPMTGIGVARWDDHPVLVITDPDGISAWQITE